MINILHEFPKNQNSIDKKRHISDQISPKRCTYLEPPRLHANSTHKRSISDQLSPRRAILHEIPNKSDEINDTNKQNRGNSIERDQQKSETKIDLSKLPPVFPSLHVRTNRFHFQDHQTYSEQVSPISKNDPAFPSFRHNEHFLSNVRRPSIPFDMGMIINRKRPVSDQVSSIKYIVNEVPKCQSLSEIVQLNNICKKLMEEQEELKKQINDQKSEIDQLKSEKQLEILENIKIPSENLIHTHRIRRENLQIAIDENNPRPNKEENCEKAKQDEALFTFMDYDHNMGETSHFGLVAEPPKSSRFPRDVFVRRVKKSRG
ncbi:unnamed protein product [Blepharisma stoltei]|uniref:Uncharacterized protein n=1 Tax=Blepharisma stoltei TaxID=1481888 RepID=A0AAU9J0Q5_9CILI|nr:unnamed protein product [Blepharisma stoltei]